MVFSFPYPLGWMGTESEGILHIEDVTRGMGDRETEQIYKWAWGTV